jgi:hypothetical protein
MDDEDYGNEVERRFGNEFSPSCKSGMGIFLFSILGAAAEVLATTLPGCNIAMKS